MMKKEKFSLGGKSAKFAAFYRAMALSGAVLLSQEVLASGFGLYEASAKSYALGGAVLGKAVDASANFHNPATLTDLTNNTITIGAMTEHPRARMKVTQNGITQPSQPMNSGCYLLPHFQMAVPLPYDFVFGLGLLPEYGLGSVYDNSWSLNYAGIDTQVESFTVNPNLAYKVTDKLSVAAGLRFLYWDFEQYSCPKSYMQFPTYPAAYHVNTRLKGDNRMEDFGYQVGLKYDLLENLSFGLVYKSDIGCHVKGKRENDGYVETPYGTTSADSRCNAVATIHMPQSLTGGFNWDITDDWHLGGVVAWTQWSAVDKVPFLFNNETEMSMCHFNWRDTWRVGIAPSWDFAENWTWLASYVYETDCSSDQYSVMLPPAERHMISTGLCWCPYEWVEIQLTYGIIIMDGKESHVSVDRPNDVYQAYRGISHATGLSFTFRF